jgi:hypothetical protein
MPTLAGIDYTHLIDGFTKGIDERSPWARVLYSIDSYDDSDDFCNALMGFGTSTGPITGITVTRGVPHAYPLSTNLYCHSATVVEGLGQPILNSDGYPRWDGGALIQAEYRPAPMDFSGGENPNHQIDPATPIPWCTQELDHSSLAFTLTNSKLKYTSGPAGVIDQPTEVYVKFEIPITIMTLTFHKLPYLPVGIIGDLSGRVNNATFLGKPAETVLFKGSKTNREWNTDGTVVQRVTLTFEARHADHPWNSLPTASDPTFYPVAGTGGVKMYKTANLLPLVQF